MKDSVVVPPTSDQICEACGELNAAQTLFCRRCTAPLTVARLDDLDGVDLRTCAAALFEILGSFVAAPASIADPDLWRAYLSAFWLRPETALIGYGEALAMRRLARGTGTWLDLGCGDGIHAALYSGWRFDPAFDAFQALDPSAKDIYNSWDPDDFAAPVLLTGRKVDWGVDIKESSASRAEALGSFARVILANATALPCPDGSIDVIFSNMMRDLGDPLSGALLECRRILTDDGMLLISAMTPEYPNHLYFAPAAQAARAQGDFGLANRLSRLDRGRSVFCQRQLTVQEWNELAMQHGLRVTGVEPIAGAAAIRFWDVGLRPFIVSLLRKRAEWQQSKCLMAIKLSVVDLIDQILTPLAANLTSRPTCMHMVRLQKAEQ